MDKRLPKRPPPFWIIQSKSAQGPLDSEQVQKLARDFNLPEDAIFALSQALAYPLSHNYVVRSVLEVLQRKAKGSIEVEKLIKKIRLARTNLKAAKDLFAEIRFNFPDEDGSGDMNDWLRAKLNEAHYHSIILDGATTRGEKLHGQWFVGKPDKRRKRDERRRAVLKAIFDIWYVAGRNVSISTVGSSSERTGPLVNFTNAVVRCITDPATDLSGETIWTEIKEWRRSPNLWASSVSISDN